MGSTGRGVPSSGDHPRRVVVVGQGYVGLPVAVRAVDVGFDVVGFDVDETKVVALLAGRSYIGDVTDADLTRALGTGRYRPSCTTRDLAGFDVAVVTVPTPLRDGAPDLSFIESAGELLARFLRPGATVVLESTTYPGTTEEVLAPLLESGSGLVAGDDFHLGFSPERIDPGNERWDFVRTPKVVSGVDETSLKVVRDFYDQLVETTVPVSGTREAELTKLLENTFRHVNIALVNELAIHARALGIDFWEVAAAARTKPFGFMSFTPGPGVGGHCLPIDPSYLSWKVERQLRSVSRFVKVANDINDHMPDHVVHRVQLGLNRAGRAVNGSRILVLGLAYKANSNDARETPATGVITGLLGLGAEVRAHDPLVGDYELDGRIARVPLSAEELASAHAVVLLTDHDDVDYELVRARASYIFDARHRITGPQVEHL
jgi:UDP-N-acetyl-D-glucosamine dehydrogenase